MASSGDAAGTLAELMGFMNHLCIVREEDAPSLPTPVATPVVATTSEETLVAIQRHVASNHEELEAVEQTSVAWNASQTTAMESESSSSNTTISSPQTEQETNQGMEYFHAGFQQQSPLFSSPPAKHVRFEFGKVNDTTTTTTTSTTAAAITPAKECDTPPGAVMAAASGNSNIHTPFGTFRRKQSGVANKNNKACTSSIMVTPEGSRKRKPAPSPDVISLPSRPSPASAPSSRRTASNRSAIQAPSARPRTIRTSPSVPNHSHVKKTPSPRRVRSRNTPSSTSSKSSSNDPPHQRRPKESSIPSVFDRLYRKETKSSASKRRRKDYHSFERIHHDVSSSQNDCPSNPQNGTPPRLLPVALRR
eukprot:scaffold134314_cov56-Attheya_sp.AAC.3